MAAAPDRQGFITVTTTLPSQALLHTTESQSVETERLILRPLGEEDLAAYHSLRSQPEVMRSKMQGRVDRDLAETQGHLNTYFQSRATGSYYLAICLKDTGEMIGSGGCQSLNANCGWPDIGYMIRKEYWGKGYAKEFLRAFLGAWERLPRVETEVQIDARTIDASTGEGRVPEQLFAITKSENGPSQNILYKCGFEHFITSKARNIRGEDGELITLPTFRFFPNKNVLQAEG